MSSSRLNYKIFAESCRLPGNGIKNWASSTCLDDLKTHLGFSPSLDDEYFLQYHKDVTTKLYQLEWLQQINAVSVTSESGRLNIYRKIIKDLTTESYVANRRSVGTGGPLDRLPAARGEDWLLCGGPLLPVDVLDL